MTTEYWLQKKSLGGWSTVTWYSDLEQARINYQCCLENGMSGYSWRLMKVEAIEVAMLEEVTEIEAPSLEHVDKISRISMSEIKSTWGQPKPVTNGWGGVIAAAGATAKQVGAWSVLETAVKPEHGLTGSVWLINHKTLVKIRVPANLVDRYIAEGYERGGPKTKFRGE